MELKQLIERAKASGWTVSRSKHNSHWRFLSPDTNVSPIYTSATPSDWRAVRNLRARLKRGGLSV